MEIPITHTYGSEATERIEACIDALLPHLTPGEYVFVGGLAIRYHAAVHGLSYPQRPFNDLDIAIKMPESLQSSVCKQFKVGHYHPKHYWAIVDPASGVKADIFTWSVAPDFVEVEYKDGLLAVQSIESQLVKTVIDTLGVTEGRNIDPKQFADAELLMSIADMAKANSLYKKHSRGHASIAAAFASAKEVAAAHPDLLVSKPHRKPADYMCTECQDTTDFPLTPLSEIAKIWRTK